MTAGLFFKIAASARPNCSATRDSCARTITGKADEISSAVTQRTNEMAAVLSDKHGGVLPAITEKGEQFVLVTSVEARPFVRMVIERLFPTLPVLSHAEIARGIHVKALGSIAG